jgi:iron complex transport system substrate-binding protein
MNGIPQRIVCLSAEAADWLWRLGAWDRVVGVTGFLVPPPKAESRPRVSGFSSANVDQVMRLNPDLVITFSDVQAAIGAELVRRGATVLATNQRTLAETEATLALLARVVGREAEGTRLLEEFRSRLEPTAPASRWPRVYFEEWNEPLITGIAWVSELIGRAGGADVFADRQLERDASGRVVTAAEVRRANPEIILAAWCGKPVDRAQIISRPEWATISAVQNHRVHELSAADVLQPGFRLVYGYERLKELLNAPVCVATPSH